MANQEWHEFAQRWIDKVRVDSRIQSIGHDTDVKFCFKSGRDRLWVHFQNGFVTEFDLNPSFNRSWSFTVSGTKEIWNEYLKPIPAPTYHDLLAMISRVPGCVVEGDRKVFARYAHVVRRFMELARETASGVEGELSSTVHALGIEPIVGHYVNMVIEGTNYRIYFEESGDGADLLLLHTAGSDSRQYYHLMKDSRLTANFHMVAFDMPLHGKSLPPMGFIPGSYKLTTDFYCSTIMTFIRTLQLNRPIVLGCSMAGEICLELAYRFPDELSGVIACEACDKVEGRLVHWARDPEINETLFVPEWIHGLMGPKTPARMKEEILWEYSQGGHGVFYGDICFYSGEWDGRERVTKIDTNRCPVYMLTGEYDFSCTPDMSKRTAEKIPGAKFKKMDGLGHFPMAENPNLFLQYLLPVLTELTQSR